MMELLASLENSGFGIWLRESPSSWAYPAVLTLHTIGLGVLVGGNAVLDLRLLGWGKAIPLAPLEKLFPVMWIGFWVNAISGVALFVGDATTKGTTWVFMSKLAIITARKRLLNLARDLQQGIEPFQASHGDLYRVRAMDVNTPVDDFDGVIAKHGSGLVAKV
jgi:hypothetical protein